MAWRTTMEPDIALPGGEPSTEETLGPTGLSALKKLRSECRGLRLRLRDVEARALAPRVVAWRPSADPSGVVVGVSDIALGGITVRGVRLLRRAASYAVSWPQRMPKDGSGLTPILVVHPALDAAVLAQLLLAAYPERAAP